LKAVPVVPILDEAGHGIWRRECKHRAFEKDPARNLVVRLQILVIYKKAPFEKSINNKGKKYERH
jgi:hypothetical protein